MPNQVLSQLGARIQHALRAFTPDDQQALTKTVRTYPKTDVYDLASALTSLGIGEAVVTVLSERGAPTPVAWTRLRSPRSLMAAIGDDAISGGGQSQPAAGRSTARPSTANPPTRRSQAEEAHRPQPISHRRSGIEDRPAPAPEPRRSPAGSADS